MIFLRKRKSIHTILMECISSLRKCQAWLLASRRAMKRDIAGLIILAGLPPSIISDTYFGAAIAELGKVRKKLLKASRDEKTPIAVRSLLEEVAEIIPSSTKMLKKLTVDELYKITEECINRLSTIRTELAWLYPEE